MYIAFTCIYAAPYGMYLNNAIFLVVVVSNGLFKLSLTYGMSLQRTFSKTSVVFVHSDLFGSPSKCSNL